MVYIRGHYVWFTARANNIHKFKGTLSLKTSKQDLYLGSGLVCVCVFFLTWRTVSHEPRHRKNLGNSGKFTGPLIYAGLRFNDQNQRFNLISHRRSSSDDPWWCWCIQTDWWSRVLAPSLCSPRCSGCAPPGSAPPPQCLCFPGREGKKSWKLN